MCVEGSLGPEHFLAVRALKFGLPVVVALVAENLAAPCVSVWTLVAAVQVRVLVVLDVAREVLHSGASEVAQRTLELLRCWAMNADASARAVPHHRTLLVVARCRVALIKVQCGEVLVECQLTVQYCLAQHTRVFCRSW